MKHNGGLRVLGQDQSPVGCTGIQRAKVASGFLCHYELVFSLSTNNRLPLLRHLEEKKTYGRIRINRGNSSPSTTIILFL